MQIKETKRQEECCSLDKNTSKENKKTGHESLLLLDMLRREKDKTERERERQRKTDRKTDRKGWSVIAYVCGVKTKKLRQPSMSTSWYTCQKQHKEKKLTNETRDFEPMQSVALPCVQW